jgi:hypothetical protein
MIRSQITFTIEERDGERYFVALSADGKIYEGHIKSDSEVDIFDCIETFMGEYNNLFRNKRREQAVASVSQIKWTSHSTQ